LQDWLALAPATIAGIAALEGDVEARQRPAMEARYIAALERGEEAAAERELVRFTHSVVTQAAALLQGLAQQAATALGLGGIPPDDQLVRMLDTADHRYAFHPS